MNDQIRTKLVHAATEYDRKESRKKGYNRYALGQYFMAIDNAAELMAEEGESLRSAIIRSFNGRLCDHLLRATNCQIMTDSECRHGIPGL